MCSFSCKFISGNFFQIHEVGGGVLNAVVYKNSDLLFTQKISANKIVFRLSKVITSKYPQRVYSVTNNEKSSSQNMHT